MPLVFPKGLLASKTFWFNLVTTLIALVTALAGLDWVKENPNASLVIAAVAYFLQNVALRLVTEAPIKGLFALLIAVLLAGTAQAQDTTVTRTESRAGLFGRRAVVVTETVQSGDTFGKVGDREVVKRMKFRAFLIAKSARADAKTKAAIKEALRNPEAFNAAYGAVAAEHAQNATGRFADIMEWLLAHSDEILKLVVQIIAIFADDNSPMGAVQAASPFAFASYAAPVCKDGVCHLPKPDPVSGAACSACQDCRCSAALGRCGAKATARVSRRVSHVTGAAVTAARRLVRGCRRCGS